MTESKRDSTVPEAGPSVPPPAEPTPTAGRLLRRARESRGLHIAAFAATLKIPQRKVEALEADRYDDLPDPAFTRALAKSACRALKIDPAPVLALLPRPDAGRLDQVSAGLNTPFREGRASPLEGAQWLRSPVLWVVVVLALAAALIAIWPASPLETTPVVVTTPADVVVPALPPGSEPAVAESLSEAAASQPPPAGAVTSTSTASSGTAPVVVPAVATPVPTPTHAVPPRAGTQSASLKAKAPSWVQVIDGPGRTRVERELLAGESVNVDGPLPMQVVVGNAGATQLRLRGVDVDLAAATRGNVARVELR